MTTLPVFYQDTAFLPGKLLTLTEDTTRHIIQVLRMNTGESIEIANGAGMAATGVIEIAAKRKCAVRVGPVREVPRTTPALHLGIAFTKNTARNEWLLEKATELGVQRIIPLITARTERERFRYDRWQNILVAGMIQSQQYWLPVLEEAAPLTAFGDPQGFAGDVLLTHCIHSLERIPVHDALRRGKDTLILIGPEGDFTEEEVTLMVQQGAKSIKLGDTRLRTETAAIAACAYFHLVNAS